MQNLEIAWAIFPLAMNIGYTIKQVDEAIPKVEAL